MEPSSFIDAYIQPLSDKILKEMKKSYLAGNFNFDLLTTEEHNTSSFFETIWQAIYFLPLFSRPK